MVRFSQANPNFIQKFYDYYLTILFLNFSLTQGLGPTGTYFVVLRYMGPEWFFEQNLGATCQNFTNNPSVYSKFWWPTILRFENLFSTGQLGTDIWRKWTENVFFGITLQPFKSRFHKQSLLLFKILKPTFDNVFFFET